MIRLTTLLALSLILSGCYEKTPNDTEAIDIAKQEISMALCGDRLSACVIEANAVAHVGARRNDHTNKITVSFNSIKANPETKNVNGRFTGGGLVSYDFDAKNGKTYVKEISLWSADGSQSIELCGHDYTFCSK
jgi:hypothetical protein